MFLFLSMTLKGHMKRTDERRKKQAAVPAYVLVNILLKVSVSVLLLMKLTSFKKNDGAVVMTIDELVTRRRR